MRRRSPGVRRPGAVAAVVATTLSVGIGVSALPNTRDGFGTRGQASRDWSKRPRPLGRDKRIG